MFNFRVRFNIHTNATLLGRLACHDVFYNHTNEAVDFSVLVIAAALSHIYTCSRVILCHIVMMQYASIYVLIAFHKYTMSDRLTIKVKQYTCKEYRIKPRPRSSILIETAYLLQVNIIEFPPGFMQRLI